MANRQYIGARYVPKFADPVEWDKALSYEALTIVTHLGNSFTSKKPVPAGVDIGNNEYWVNTGNYNAQLNEAINAIKSTNPKWVNVKDYMLNPDSETEDIGAAIVRASQAGVKTIYIPNGTYTMKTNIDVIDICIIMDNEANIIGAENDTFRRIGHFRIANNITDNSDGLIINSNNYWDGPEGHTSSSLVVTDDAYGNGHYEWALLSILNNHSNVGSNVAIYGQANKKGDGATWGACFEANDERISEQNGQLIGAEITYKCAGSIPDRRARVVLHESLSNNDKTKPATIDTGILITGDDNLSVKKGLEFYNVKLETGIDFTDATFTDDGCAISMGYEVAKFDSYKVFKGSDGVFYIRSPQFTFAVAPGSIGFGESSPTVKFTTESATGTVKQTLDAKLNGVSDWVKIIKDGKDCWMPIFEA